MNREDLIKRQDELTEEFNNKEALRQDLLGKVKDIQVDQHQLTGAYEEITRLITIIDLNQDTRKKK